MKLPRSFYNQQTLKVAQQLLGTFLTRKIGARKIVGKIVETEAYVGFADKASHASRGRTERTAIMFGRPGFVYIYMIYGMYYCLNIVTEREEYPAAVLIRAVEPVTKSRIRPAGPGKVCQFYKIDKRYNGTDMCGRTFWIEQKGSTKNISIVRTKRVGVDYAGAYRHKRWRFYIKGNEFVSKK
jgi:DNA-3-methyladenine glycosylase